MKNSINITMFLIISFMMILISCEQEIETPIAATQQVTPSRGVSKSTSPEDIACDHTLEAYAQAMAGLANNPYYRHLIFDLAQQGFDDEPNVLARVLADSMRNTGRNLLADLRMALDMTDATYPEHFPADLKYAIAGLPYYETKAFTQIYIPHADSMKRDSMPTLVIDYGYNDEVVTGMRLNAAGGFDYITVDETYAKNNMVWVVGMNESIESDKVLNKIIAGESQKEESEITPSDTTAKNWKQAINFAYLEEVKIHDKKEPWLSGAAEVCVGGVQFGAPNHHNTNCDVGEAVGQQPLARIYDKHLFKWKKVKSNRVLVAVSRNNIQKGGTLRHDEGFFIVIWEKDRRRKNEKHVGHLPSQCGFRISYTSNETPYGISSLMPYQSSFSLNGPQYTNPIWNTAMPTTNKSKTGYDYWDLAYGQNYFKFKYTNQ